MANVTDSRVLMAIDGNSLVHRSFHAQARTGVRSADGRPMWAVRGLLTQLVAAVERVAPDAVIVGFDDPASSRRRELWPQYKAHRAIKLERLVDQLLFAAEVLSEMGVPVVVPPGLEADDVLASAARFAPTVGARTVIVTSDRDAFALIDQHTSVLRVINGGIESCPMLTPSRLELMLGVRPDQYRDYAALRGDASDNLPGVRGIGPKTSAALIAALGSARAAFEDLEDGGERVLAAIGPAGARRLADPDARAAWELNCQLMAMHDDVPICLDYNSGAGCLPLAADAVRQTYLAHQLSWLTGAALRALAGQDDDAIGRKDDVEPSNSKLFWSPGKARYGPLPARRKVDQPALF